MNMNNNSSHRGGARKGSGRPMTDLKVNLFVRISQTAADLLLKISNKSAYIDALIRADGDDGAERR